MKKKSSDNLKIIDATQLSLQEWLNMISIDKNDRDYLIMDFQFPTTKHLEEYISNIEKYTEDEVKDLIFRFIIPSAFLGNDRNLMDWVFDSGKFDINTILKHEFFLRRLICMNKKTHHGNPFLGLWNYYQPILTRLLMWCVLTLQHTASICLIIVFIDVRILSH
ncbi:hypothetical protein ACI1AU_001164 [Cronobacter turicensis]